RLAVPLREATAKLRFCFEPGPDGQRQSEPQPHVMQAILELRIGAVGLFAERKGYIGVLRSATVVVDLSAIGIIQLRYGVGVRPVEAKVRQRLEGMPPRKLLRQQLALDEAQARAARITADVVVEARDQIHAIVGHTQ